MIKPLTTFFSTLFISSISFLSAMPCDLAHDDDNCADDVHILPIFPSYEDLTADLTSIKIDADRSDKKWDFVTDVAQYKGGDWSKCVGVAHQVSRKQAKRYAENHPDITFFFYVKGCQMVLENDDAAQPYMRVFYQGDAVFFSGDAPHWGSAIDLADGYVKKQS